jgi:dihydroneopterin aldolase
MAVIRLHNMTFFAHHGVLAAERELGQTFEVDVEISSNLEAAASSDDLSQTIDYREIYHLVKEVVVGEEFQLLEALAGAILEALSGRYRADVLVRVRKPHPPLLAGSLDSVEVELSTT